MTRRSEITQGRWPRSRFRDAARSPLVGSAALIILSLGGLVALGWLVAASGHGFDFYAYWAVDVEHPYVITSGLGAFHYPPPFVWLAAPLGALPFEVGYWLYTGLGIAVLAWLTRRWMLAWLLFPPVSSERAAPAWAFVALAKVTTEVIGLWPVLRRDWRSAALLGATLLIVVVPTILLAPGLWGE